MERPLLRVDCCGIMDPMPYGFHWTRDASLSLLTLLERVERSTRRDMGTRRFQTDLACTKCSKNKDPAGERPNDPISAPQLLRYSEIFMVL